MFKILQANTLAQGSMAFVIAAPEIAQAAKPGQFVMVRLNEESERIPLTLADMDPDNGTITLVVLEIGFSTKKINSLKEGDEILDIAGPLGRPTHVDKKGTIVGIGGGIGIAAVYPVIKGFKNDGKNIISIIGARTKDLLFWEKKVKDVSDKAYVTTDDGSSGQKGFVIDPLKELIQNGPKIDTVFAVGPTPMMRAVAQTTREHKIHTLVSLNPIMIDATGMCGCCRVNIGGETKFACVDGPDFDAHKVDFNLLLNRQKMYLEKEKSYE